MFKTGLVSISFRSLEYTDIIALCKKNGLEYIEWGSDVHAPCNDRDRLYEIAALQAQNDITCSSYGTYFKLGLNDTDELKSYIDAAKILGTDILRLWCGQKNYEDMTPEEREYIISESKKASRIAEAMGVTLCMECHNKTYTNCLTGAVELMERVDSEAFRMYWQPNQYKSFDENCEYAEKIAPYTKNIHVFNWKDKYRFPLENAIDIWKKYLSYFSGEQKALLEFMPDNSPDSLTFEAVSLNKIIKGE